MTVFMAAIEGKGASDDAAPPGKAEPAAGTGRPTAEAAE
jgi:hypothetical protein